MKAHVSFGSQPQNRPQAASAQMAPAMTAKVQIGKPKTAVRCATRSSAPAPGSREIRPPSPTPPVTARPAGEPPAPPHAARHGRLVVAEPEQVQDAGDAADEENPEADDRGAHMDR